MAWDIKTATDDYLRALLAGSKLSWKKFGRVMSSDASKQGLDHYPYISRRTVLQKHFDTKMNIDHIREQNFKQLHILCLLCFWLNMSSARG